MCAQLKCPLYQPSAEGATTPLPDGFTHRGSDPCSPPSVFTVHDFVYGCGPSWMRDCSSPKKCISAYSAHIYEENTPSLVSPCITSDGGTQMHGLLRRRETCDIKKLVRSSCSEREFSRLKRGRLRTFAQHSETVNIACPLRHAQQFKLIGTICANVPLYFRRNGFGFASALRAYSPHRPR